MQEYMIEPMEHVEVVNLDARKKRFVFENRDVKIDELMNMLLTKYSVRDINISEPEIESLIRKIYNGEVL